MPAPVFSELQKRFMRQAYLRQGLLPRDVTVALNKKFGTAITHTQVQRYISAKLSKRKKLIDEKVGAALEKSDAAIAREHGAVLKRFAEKSVAGADKAFQMVERATTSRDLASAAGAAKTLVALYRESAGIADANTPRATTYNFNFITAEPKTREQLAAEATDAVADIVEVEVSKPDDDDDEDLEELEEDDGGKGEAPPVATSSAAA